MRTKIKILSLLIVFFFLGCSKDKEDDIKKSIANTVWSSNENGVKETYSFVSEISVINRVTYSGSVRSLEFEYTYDYNYPTVNMYPTLSDYAELKGFISDNTMNVVNKSTGQTVSIVVLTK